MQFELGFFDAGEGDDGRELDGRAKLRWRSAFGGHCEYYTVGVVDRHMNTWALLDSTRQRIPNLSAASSLTLARLNRFPQLLLPPFPPLFM